MPMCNPRGHQIQACGLIKGDAHDGTCKSVGQDFTQDVEIFRKETHCVPGHWNNNGNCESKLNVIYLNLYRNIQINKLRLDANLICVVFHLPACVR